MKRTVLQNRGFLAVVTVCTFLAVSGCLSKFVAENKPLVSVEEEAPAAPAEEPLEKEEEQVPLSSLEGPAEEIAAPVSLETPAPEPPAETAPEMVAEPEPETSAPPAPEVVEKPKAQKSLRLSEKYPDLTGGILSEAALEELNTGVLLSSGDIVITEDMFNKEQSKLSKEQQESGASFALFESMATKALLDDQVQGDTDITPGDPAWEGLLKAYVDSIAGPAEASEEEAAVFFRENKDLFGDTPFDEVKQDLQSYLGQERQQGALADHIRNFGRNVPIRLHGSWADLQAKRAKNNAIDKARAAGKPLLVDFYADWCGPCKSMKPSVEALRDKYADDLNVLFIDVEKEVFLAQRHKADSIPLLLFFDGKGALVSRVEGYMSALELQKELEKVGIK